ncbi:MAG TPA: rhodanese-like domain-containing protein [Alcanivoracaceae bacterium]|nr:rhodanese-like domain-containing protein [Alcanivoracaceae bacterium]
MDNLVTFIGNHPVLVSTFVVLVLLLVFTETKRAGQSVSAQIVTNLVNRDNGLIVDIRNSDEFREGHIPGSMNIPMANIVDHVEKIKGHKDKPVILVCNTGMSTASVGKQLKEQGFSQIYRLAGGIQSWRSDNLPVVKG